MVSKLLEKINKIFDEILSYISYLEGKAWRCRVCGKISGHGSIGRGDWFICIDCSNKDITRCQNF